MTTTSITLSGEPRAGDSFYEHHFRPCIRVCAKIDRSTRWQRSSAYGR